MKKILLLLFILSGFSQAQIISKWVKPFYSASTKAPITTGAFYAVPYDSTYPAGRVAMTHLGNGVWEAVVNIGTYKIYYNDALLSNYSRVWVGEQRQTDIAERFNSNNKLTNAGINDTAITTAKIKPQSITPALLSPEALALIGTGTGIAPDGETLELDSTGAVQGIKKDAAYYVTSSIGLTAAVSDIGTAQRELILSKNTYTNLPDTIKSNIVLNLQNGAILGESVVIEGGIIAGRTQIFADGIDVDLSNAKIKEIYPENFGVVPDNSTDNTAQMEKLMASKAKVISFGSGTYLTDRIIIRSDQTIKGEVPGTSVIKRNGMTQFMLYNLNRYGNGDSNIVIKDLTIDGNYDANTDSALVSHLIDIWAATSIIGEGNNNIRIENCELKNNFLGISVYNREIDYDDTTPTTDRIQAENIVIANNTIHNIKNKAIEVGNSRYVTVTGNNIYDAVAGIQLIWWANHCTVTGNTVQCSDSVLAVAQYASCFNIAHGSSYNVISGNTAVSNENCLIFRSDASNTDNTMQGNVISNNSFYSSYTGSTGTNGIIRFASLMSGDTNYTRYYDNIISGNTFKGGYFTLNFAGTTAKLIDFQRNHFVNNIIIPNATTNIDLGVNPANGKAGSIYRDLDFDGNYIFGNGSNGSIQLTYNHDKISITRNKAYNVTDFVRVATTSTGTHTVVNYNEVDTCTRFFDGASASTYDGGIEMIKGNVIRNSGTGAINITSAAGFLAIADNEIWGTSDCIDIASDTTTLVYDNIFRQGSVAVRNTGTGTVYIKDNDITGMTAGSPMVATTVKTVSDGLQKIITAQFDATSSNEAGITGATVTLITGKSYEFKCYLFVDPDSVGGVRINMGGTVTPGTLIFNTTIYNATGLSKTARSTALSADITDAGWKEGLIIIEGFISVAAGGTFLPRFGQSTTSGTSSVRVGSYFICKEIL